MKKRLAQKDLAGWVGRLLPGWAVHAPVRRGGTWVYEKIDDPAAVALDSPPAVVPPKGIVFPQRERLLEFAAAPGGRPEARETLPEPEPAVVLGVRPCDARALTLTDLVFDAPPADPYYRRRREATAIVALGCAVPPSPNCFCLSVGGAPHAAAGADVLMTDLGGAWLLEALTPGGEALLSAGGELLGRVTARETAAAARVHREAEALVPRRLGELEGVADLLPRLFDDPLWDRRGMSCLSCGICTFLCPTCHCFDVNDEVLASSPLRGVRVRTWDTCQFPDFTMHSSGHNPRPDKASRVRQRISHKFSYFPLAHGSFQCTGCGRCISLCPVGIDLIDILEEVKSRGR